MRLTTIGIVFLSLFFVLLVAVGFADAAPQMAASLVEGRNYDQSHDTGYIDWSGPVAYVYITHRDFTSLPPEEGGTSCGSGCQEWVTRINNNGIVSGSFDRDVSYFEVMVGFTHDGGVGSATVRACGSVGTSNLYLGPGGGLPGFVSLSLTVPAGCRSWSLSASGGYVDFRSVDVNYVIVPPAATFTPSHTPTTTPTFTLPPTATLTSTPTITNTPANTATSTFTITPTLTPANTSTLTVTPSVTMTLSLTPTQTVTTAPTFIPTATTIPSQLLTKTATAIQPPPQVSIPDRWWIWETGELKVTHGNGSLASVKVTISDPLNRWPPMVMEYDPVEIPGFIAWDRRFADGTLAPSGEYPIMVRACDFRRLCGQDTGVIMIPIVENLEPVMTPLPTKAVAFKPSATVAVTQVFPTQTPALPALTLDKAPTPEQPPLPLWQILGLLGLFVVITSASLVDPRPDALKRLGDFFRQISTHAPIPSIEDKQNNDQKRM